MQPASGEDVGGARSPHAAATADRPGRTAWHSSQYPSLPEVYVQNASLEIAWSRVVFDERTIAGTVLMPFLTRDHEGVDVNKPLTGRWPSTWCRLARRNCLRRTDPVRQLNGPRGHKLLIRVKWNS
jgi:hypothetical protein